MSGLCVRVRLPDPRRIAISELAEIADFLDEALIAAVEKWELAADAETDTARLAQDIDALREEYGLQDLAAGLRRVAASLADGEYSLVRERDIRPPRPDVVRTGRW